MRAGVCHGAHRSHTVTARRRGAVLHTRRRVRTSPAHSEPATAAKIYNPIGYRYSVSAVLNHNNACIAAGACSLIDTQRGAMAAVVCTGHLARAQVDDGSEAAGAQGMSI